MLIDVLGQNDAAQTYRSLAGLMNLNGDPDDQATRDYINAHTLIRRIENYDSQNTPWQRPARLNAVDGQTLTFEIAAQQLPTVLPDNWQVQENSDGSYTAIVRGALDVMLPDRSASQVSSAGQLPTGFAPENLYQSRLMGKRVTSKQLALGLCDMPGAFINAYVLGSVGVTGAIVGACATFLYNLLYGINDIRSGRCRVVIVGNSEAPIRPEVIDGYRTMGALAEDDALMALDGTSGQPDYRRATRPFGENCGFTLSESAVYTVLMDDDLALELGATIHGAIGDVFVNADGFKKSIPSPGIGNYITVAKAMGLARTLLGEKAAAQRSLCCGARNRHPAESGKRITNPERGGQGLWCRCLAGDGA